MRPVDAKQEIRNRVWDRLKAEGASAFPGARGRIPNFVGAAAAAETLAGLDVWQKARHGSSATPTCPKDPFASEPWKRARYSTCPSRA